MTLPGPGARTTAVRLSTPAPGRGIKIAPKAARYGVTEYGRITPPLLRNRGLPDGSPRFLRLVMRGPAPQSNLIVPRESFDGKWRLLNLLIGYLLVGRVGKFDPRRTLHALAFGAGFVMMSVMLSRAFGRFHGGLL